MIQRIISGLALFLGAGLYGCSTAAERPAPPANAATDRGTYICNLQMIDVHNGWASTGLVAGHSLLLRTTNGGESWRDCSPRGIPVDVDADATGCFLGAENAWLPTYERTTHTAGLLRTTNGGSAWVWFRFMTPAPSTPAAFQSVHFYTAKNGIASETDVGLGSADCQFYETQDGGANWFPLPIFPPGADPDADDMPTMIHLCNLCGDSVAFHPPANVIITHGDMGDETPKNGVRLSISDNMGRNWRDVKLPLPSKNFATAWRKADRPSFWMTRTAGCRRNFAKTTATPFHSWDRLFTQPTMAARHGRQCRDCLRLPAVVLEARLTSSPPRTSLSAAARIYM